MLTWTFVALAPFTGGAAPRRPSRARQRANSRRFSVRPAVPARVRGSFCIRPDDETGDDGDRG